MLDADTAVDKVGRVPVHGAYSMVTLRHIVTYMKINYMNKSYKEKIWHRLMKFSLGECFPD